MTSSVETMAAGGHSLSNEWTSSPVSSNQCTNELVPKITNNQEVHFLLLSFKQKRAGFSIRHLNFCVSGFFWSK